MTKKKKLFSDGVTKKATGICPVAFVGADGFEPPTLCL